MFVGLPDLSGPPDVDLSTAFLFCRGEEEEVSLCEGLGARRGDSLSTIVDNMLSNTFSASGQVNEYGHSDTIPSFGVGSFTFSVSARWFSLFESLELVWVGRSQELFQGSLLDLFNLILMSKT